MRNNYGQGVGESEQAILVAVQLPRQTDEEVNESLEELVALTDTAGGEVLTFFIQKRKGFNPSTLIGSGKVQEIKRTAANLNADLVIFDDDLTPAQQGRLGSLFNVKVIDRKALILDIFAQHAHTREGSAQVELAQLNYLLPRIRGRGLELSRLGGGIGTRGPGETKLEVDRRRIRVRMRHLRRELVDIRKHRATQRKQRTRAGVPTVSLIGYTNSGKSSLLNALTDAQVLVEDKLFSTLDSTTRQLTLPNKQTVVITDTVGFIRKLPHELIAAFRSTLEEVIAADVLIHLIDAASEEDEIRERVKAVREVLSELGAESVPRLEVLNKIDMLYPAERESLSRNFRDVVQISTKTGEGVKKLLDYLSLRITSGDQVTLYFPLERGDLLSRIYRDGQVVSKRVEDSAVRVDVILSPELLKHYLRYKRKLSNS